MSAMRCEGWRSEVSDVTLEEEASGPVLTNGSLTVAVHLNKGTFSIIDAGSGRAVVTNAATAVVLSSGPTFTSRGTGFASEWSTPVEARLGRGLSITLQRESEEQEPALRLTIALFQDHPFAVIHTELVNSGPAAVRVVAFHVFDAGLVDLGSPAASWRFYKQGWQSWSPTLVLDCSGEDIATAAPVIDPGTQPEARDGLFVSELMTAIVSTESKRGLVAGFITTADQLSQLRLDREQHTVTASSCADGITVPPGGRLSSERLLLDPTTSPLESMERYGDALGRMMEATPAEEVATGWCSWYYYWHRVTEEHIIANLEELAHRRAELPLEYVQIDDGYQAEIGDWLTVNGKFPHGMKWLADRIHEHRFKAGLWLAPFLMGARSQLYREHPDWAVLYKPGKPYIAIQNWGQDCYALDLTRPEVIKWLGEVFRTVCGKWGFDYVKVDFIYAGAVNGIRYDPNVTRAQAYRRGLEAIRDAAGDRFVLACGNPIGPSIGLVDGARVGPDIAPHWRPTGNPRDVERNRMSEPSALNSIRNSITRWWMHGRLWQSDPDCLLARDTETALTPDEVRTLATVVAMSGGMVLDSDDLTLLSDERQKWLAMLLPPFGKSAQPLDLFDTDIPRILRLDCGTHIMIAVFNWSDEPASMQAPLPARSSHVFDVWNNADLGASRDAMDLDLPPHGCALLAVTLPVTEVRAGYRPRRYPALLVPQPWT